MFESGKNRQIVRKCFEIAYAIFRVSANVADLSFAGMLRNESANLVSNAAKEQYGNAAKNLTALEYLVKLAAEADFINFSNTELLLREMGILEGAIAGLPNGIQKPIIDTSDLSEIFTSHLRIEKKAEEAKEIKEEIQSESGVSGLIRSGIRQAAILDRIRQSGNCRIKDIQEVLPDSSERTIRYDLQSLVEQNLIERVGNGGPSVFYRIRQTA